MDHWFLDIRSWPCRPLTLQPFNPADPDPVALWPCGPLQIHLDSGGYGVWDSFTMFLRYEQIASSVKTCSRWTSSVKHLACGVWESLPECFPTPIGTSFPALIGLNHLLTIFPAILGLYHLFTMIVAASIFNRFSRPCHAPIVTQLSINHLFAWLDTSTRYIGKQKKTRT